MAELQSVGIIAEYNPFHKGHAYHLKKAREITNADCVIVVMSGNFIQRGEPALLDKYTRAQMALKNGADLVIELPVISACSSAPYFAKGSTAILNELKVPFLCFGSETGDIAILDNITHMLLHHKEELDIYINKFVAEGFSYPTARSKAISTLCTSVNTDIINMPNNILGIEYILEIKQNNYNITPITITRCGNNYNDTMLTKDFSSATAIRNSIFKENIIPMNTVPQNVYETLKEYERLHYFPAIDDFSQILKYRLLELKHAKTSEIRILNIADMPDYLLNKLIKSFEKCSSITELIESVKSKDLTYTRISRAIMHLLLNITNSDIASFVQKPCEYIRVLGFNNTGAAYLSSIKHDLNCPLITKPANFSKYLVKDIFASDLYNMIVNENGKQPLIDDFRHRIIKEPSP